MSAFTTGPFNVSEEIRNSQPYQPLAVTINENGELVFPKDGEKILGIWYPSSFEDTSAFISICGLTFAQYEEGQCPEIKQSIIGHKDGLVRAAVEGEEGQGMIVGYDDKIHKLAVVL